MMILLFFLIGIFATIVGAIAPGASNLAVIKTTVNENIRQGLKIGYGAGIGEVILAFLALNCGMMVQDFFVMHVWVQYALVVALFVVGIILLRSKPKDQKEPSAFSSKYMTGFVLSIVNPPVLIYWVVVFSMLNASYSFNYGTATPVLLIFFGGVFLGKVITLYGYGKLGYLIQNKKGDFKCLINRIMGIILMSIAAIQAIKLIFF